MMPALVRGSQRHGPIVVDARDRMDTARVLDTGCVVSCGPIWTRND